MCECDIFYTYMVRDGIDRMLQFQFIGQHIGMHDATTLKLCNQNHTHVGLTCKKVLRSFRHLTVCHDKVRIYQLYMYYMFAKVNQLSFMVFLINTV